MFSCLALLILVWLPCLIYWSPNEPSTSSYTLTSRSHVQTTLVGPLKEFTVKKIKELDRLLVDVISKDFQPFSIIEDKGFREFAKALEPRYCLPSRKTIIYKLLPERYGEVIYFVKQLIGRAGVPSMHSAFYFRGETSLSCPLEIKM